MASSNTPRVSPAMKLTLCCRVSKASFLGLEFILSPGSGVLCYLGVAGSQRGYLACVCPWAAEGGRKTADRGLGGHVPLLILSSVYHTVLASHPAWPGSRKQTFAKSSVSKGHWSLILQKPELGLPALPGLVATWPTVCGCGCLHACDTKGTLTITWLLFPLFI